MQIIHLEASSGWGGQEIRILREAEGMRARGHQIIFAVMRGAKLVAKARLLGFTVYEVNFRRPYWLACLFQLLHIFRRHQIQVVNTHSSLDSWIGGIAARLAGKKLVRTRHLSTPVKSGWNSRFIYGTLADFVVTTCERIIEPLFNQSGKARNLFQSIATGVDPQKIATNPIKSEDFRKKMGATNHTFLVGTACVMRSWKGIDDFIRAAHLLRDQLDLKWVIIGGGHEEKYRLMAKELKLEDILTFTGHLDDPFSEIGALDAFALLSTANEGVSQAILQAAYLKKPLIATTTGGLSEVCIHEETGLIVDIHSPEQIAKAALAMKEDRALALKYGEQAHKLVIEQFTFDRTLDEMEKVFERVSALN